MFATPQTITFGGTQLEFTDTTGATRVTDPAAGVTVSGPATAAKIVTATTPRFAVGQAGSTG